MHVNLQKESIADSKLKPHLAYINPLFDVRAVVGVYFDPQPPDVEVDMVLDLQAASHTMTGMNMVHHGDASFLEMFGQSSKSSI